tara:strand:- start:63 stop:1124 length:1062 start_codon:yes stop_codon:yes gene_type:complete
MNSLKISNKIIGPDKPVFFIAEAGVNHNGSIVLAKKMIDIAKQAGADAIKFQSFKTENIILKNAPKSKYHLETTGSNKKMSWYDLLKTQEMSERMHFILKEYCDKKKIIFLSTPYDNDSVDLLTKLKINAFKIASTDNQNYPLLKYIAKKNKPIIISTAMSNFEEIQKIYNFIKKINKKIIVLQCTGNYPSKINETNLNVMKTYKKKLKCVVGYSDHTIGNYSAIAATAAGAKVIEKHFTLNKKMFGPDHRMSMSPKELKKVIKDIRIIESILGSDVKKILPSEIENRKKLKKSLVSCKFIPKGKKLSKKYFKIKRPGTGLSPEKLLNISNYVSLMNIKADTTIKKKMIRKIK